MEEHKNLKKTDQCQKTQKNAPSILKLPKLLLQLKVNYAICDVLIFRSIFTALHGMQRGLNDEISVCLSVRPSVRQTRAL